MMISKLQCMMYPHPVSPLSPVSLLQDAVPKDATSHGHRTGGGEVPGGSSLRQEREAPWPPVPPPTPGGPLTPIIGWAARPTSSTRWVTSPTPAPGGHSPAAPGGHPPIATGRLPTTGPDRPPTPSTIWAIHSHVAPGWPPTFSTRWAIHSQH